MPDLSLQHLNFSPEFQLLINCSWVAPAELVRFQQDRIDFQLSRIGDWKRFLSLVDRHRVSVLVDRALAQRRARLPGHVRDRLRAQSFRARSAALIQAKEWSRLADRFSGAGVDLMARANQAAFANLLAGDFSGTGRVLKRLIAPSSGD